MARTAAFGRHSLRAGSVGHPRAARSTALAGTSRRPVEAASGTLLLLAANGFGDGDVARLEQLYSAAREEEWAEFNADCGKYLVELEKEERIGKYTLAELEEEEQSLDRLRRWYRELRSRDLLGTPSTTQSATALKLCEERFERYADHVYAALSSPRG